MKSNIKFLINNRFQILMEDGTTYKSNIQDISSEYIAISIPAFKKKHIFLRQGEKVSAIYFAKDSVYKFNTVVIGRKQDRVRMILLAHPKEFQRIQRREFVRISFVVDIWCISVGKCIEGEQIKSKECEFFNATSIDLSGNGIKIYSDRENELGEILNIILPIKDEVITIKGKIIRKDKIDNIDKCGYGVKFIDVNDNISERIIMLLFQIMRERRTCKTKEE